MREIRSPLDGISSPFASRRFTPSLLFRANEPGYVYDLNDVATLFKDTAGTQPVTAAGDAVARRNDKSGRGNHATQSDLTKRPLYSLLPANGVRNLANGSADVGNAAVWPASRVSAGVTITRVSSGFDVDGLPYVDVRVQGTATSTFSDIAYDNGISRTAATVGQSFTGSAFVRLVGGTTANITGISVLAVEETAPSTYVGQGGNSQIVGTTEVLMTGTRTIASGNQARTAVVLGFTNGATIDVTYRIKALQFELGPTRTAYQFNYAATNIAEPPFSRVGALLYDGVDDFMVTAAIDFSGTDEVFLCHGVRKTSDAAVGTLVELSAAADAGTGGFFIRAPTSAGGANYQGISRGTITVFPTIGGISSPDTSVLTLLGDISGDSAILRRNGVVGSNAITDQGTGNYQNAPIYFGGRGGTSLFFKGYEFSSICRGAIPSAAQIVGAENWVRARTAGAY